MSYMILVTGGAGFIGSNIIERLLNEGYEVGVLDNFSTGKKANLEEVVKKTGKHVEVTKGDTRNFDSRILKDVDLVLHEAAQIDVRKSVSDPKYDLDVNVNGTINLLENMRKVDVKRVIYASSGGAVYGNPEYLPCDERHPTNPLSPYGASKLAAEKYIQIYHETYGIDYVNLRYANVYGPRQDPLGEAGVITIFLNRILNGENPVIFGDGSQTRDYIHVSDVVEANMLAVDQRINNETVNIGTGIETSVNQLVKIISGLLGKQVVPEYTEKRKGEVQRICLDISRLKWHGFQPEYDLSDGIKNVLDWMNSFANKT